MVVPPSKFSGVAPFKAASELSPEPSHGRAFRAHVNSCEYCYELRVGIQGDNSYSYPASTWGSNGTLCQQINATSAKKYMDYAKKGTR
jgi:hypothetical protein